MVGQNEIDFVIEELAGANLENEPDCRFQLVSNLMLAQNVFAVSTRIVIQPSLPNRNADTTVFGLSSSPITTRSTNSKERIRRASTSIFIRGYMLCMRMDSSNIDRNGKSKSAVRQNSSHKMRSWCTSNQAKSPIRRNILSTLWLVL